MLDFIMQYWLNVLFGLICAGGSALYAWFKRTKKKEQVDGRADFLKEVKKEISKEISTELKVLSDRDTSIQSQINALKESTAALKKGLLSASRKEFYNACEFLINKEEDITLEEYRMIVEDHDAYNGLGGNHLGDELFALVEKKYEAQITK